MVEGYTIGDYASGPVESARVIAIFNRSNMSDSTKDVEVQAVYLFP